MTPSILTVNQNTFSVVCDGNDFTGKTITCSEFHSEEPVRNVVISLASAGFGSNVDLKRSLGY